MKYLIKCLGLHLIFATLVSANGKTVEINDVAADETAYDMMPERNVTVTMKGDGVGLDGCFTLKRDFDCDAKVNVVGYEGETNSKDTYQKMPSFNYTTTLANFLENDTYTYPDLLACSDMPKNCPVKAATYCLNHCKIGEHWPNLPYKKYKIHVYLYIGDKVESELIAKVTIDKPKPNARGKR